MNPFQLKGTSGTVINQRFGLPQRSLIGSGEDCDIRVQGHDVALHHAEILAGPDSVLIRCPEPGRMVRVNVQFAYTFEKSGQKCLVTNRRPAKEAT